MAGHKFIGFIPASIDPETTGVPFEDADSRFGEQPLFEFVSSHYPDRLGEIGNLSFSEILTRKPQEVQSKWWSWRDVAVPFLLRLLINGKIMAFGSTDRADAPPVWIPPRLWKDLQPDLDNKRCFSGAGATFWNVRVVDPHETTQETSATEDVAHQPSVLIGHPQQLFSPSKRGPKTVSLEMTSMLNKLHQEGHVFSSKMDAYNAVLSKLNIKNSRRGYSYDSFCRHCGALVDQNST